MRMADCCVKSPIKNPQRTYVRFWFFFRAFALLSIHSHPFSSVSFYFFSIIMNIIFSCEFYLNSAFMSFSSPAIILFITSFISSSVKVLSDFPNVNENDILFFPSSIPFPVYTANTS